ncbi:PH domain-containing protein [Rarobacter incanus]|uniref:YdbS-like PH domain-containing protein n=1 Tax=Rarobacter incanus TaxID=153494 RepID=A0A542SP10_9MICO|nr:PH domain-containing protein [Rarobacter incanus]TQK76360.1 hypothetical protein FB389_1030 [Rarobacter incanus]
MASDNRHDPFDVQGTWEPLAPAMRTIKQLGAAAAFLVIALIPVIFAIIFGRWWIWAIAGGVVALALVNAALIPRRVRAFGFMCREDDLVIREGVMLRTLTVIPYGRIQTVNVASGPWLRRAGLSSVTIATASSQTQGGISGIPTARAAALRDHLTAAGEARMLKL